jgi:hypothetical protein
MAASPDGLSKVQKADIGRLGTPVCSRDAKIGAAIVMGLINHDNLH